MLIHPYYINKVKQLLEKVKNKIGATSPSSTFANIGVVMLNSMRGGIQSAQLEELHRKLYEPYRLPRRVYAQEYKPVQSVVFAFRQAQAFYEDD